MTMAACRTREWETLSHCHGLHFDQTIKRITIRKRLHKSYSMQLILNKFPFILFNFIFTKPIQDLRTSISSGCWEYFHIWALHRWMHNCIQFDWNRMPSLTCHTHTRSQSQTCGNYASSNHLNCCLLRHHRRRNRCRDNSTAK